MSDNALSPNAQNYLKAIWNLSEWSTDPVTTSSLAEKTNVTLSTSSGAVTKLCEKGLVNRKPYGEIKLTKAGQTEAMKVVRRHRLIESFLTSALGYSWDEVDKEADALEHVISDLMIERIDSYLGYPSFDPHGDPIPSADGDLPKNTFIRLTDLLANSGSFQVKVERISDNDPELLRYFTKNNIEVGSVLTVVKESPYSNDVLVKLNRRTKISLGQTSASSIFVSIDLPQQTS